MLSSSVMYTGNSQNKKYLKGEKIVMRRVKNISAQKGKMPKIEYYGGDVYEGEIQNSKPHGVGKMTYKDGQVREGIWNDGEIVYEGQLNEQGEPDGTGTSFHRETYDGDWRNGKRHGEGTAKMIDGSVSYKGGWKNDLPDGNGTFKYRNGSVYTGGFRAGKMHGNGVMTYTNGTTYDGQWKNDKQDGQGTMKFHNGHVYKGEFSKGKLHGKGSFVNAAGDTIQGEWKEGMKCGVFQKIVRVEVIEQVYYENDELKADSYVKRERDTSNDIEDLPPIKRRSVCVSSP